MVPYVHTAQNRPFLVATVAKSHVGGICSPLMLLLSSQKIDGRWWSHMTESQAPALASLGDSLFSGLLPSYFCCHS